MQHTVRTTIKLHSYTEGAGPRDWNYPYQARVHWRLYSRSDHWIRITVCHENLEKGNSSQYNKGAISFSSSSSSSFFFFWFTAEKRKKKGLEEEQKENNKNETKTIKQWRQRQNGPFLFYGSEEMTSVLIWISAYLRGWTLREDTKSGCVPDYHTFGLHSAF